MTTNREWLYSLDVADLADWFDSEHESTLDGDTAAENADSRELILTDLEKKTREWHDYDGNYMRIYSGVAYAQMKELLDRQAAITEEQTRCKWVTASADEIAAWRSKAEKLKEQVYELTAERDELKELNEYHALQYELASEDADRLQEQVDELTAERDEWKSRCEKGKAQFDAILAERELYREALSQLLDTVTDGMGKVSALLDSYDEGMA